MPREASLQRESKADDRCRVRDDTAQGQSYPIDNHHTSLAIGVRVRGTVLRSPLRFLGLDGLDLILVLLLEILYLPGELVAGAVMIVRDASELLEEEHGLFLEVMAASANVREKLRRWPNAVAANPAAASAPIPRKNPRRVDCAARFLDRRSNVRCSIGHCSPRVNDRLQKAAT